MDEVKDYKPWSPEKFGDYMGEQPPIQQFQTAVEGMVGPKILKQRGEEVWMEEQRGKAKLHYTGKNENDPNSVRYILNKLYDELEKVWFDAVHEYNKKIGISREIRPIRSMNYKSLFEFIKEFTENNLSQANEIYNEIQRIIRDLNKMNEMGFLDFNEGPRRLSDMSLVTFPGKEIKGSMEKTKDLSKKLIYGPMKGKMSIIDMISDLNKNLDEKIQGEIAARNEREIIRKEREEYFESIMGKFIPEGTDPNDPIFQAYARFPRGTGPEVESEPGAEDGDPIEEFKNLAETHLGKQSWPDHTGTELPEDIKKTLSKQIRDTYKELSLILHPDKNIDDPKTAKELFQEMKKLYDKIKENPKYKLAGYFKKNKKNKKKRKKEKKGKKTKKSSKKKMPIKTKKPKKPKKTKKAKKKS